MNIYSIERIEETYIIGNLSKWAKQCDAGMRYSQEELEVDGWAYYVFDFHSVDHCSYSVSY